MRKSKTNLVVSLLLSLVIFGALSDSVKARKSRSGTIDATIPSTLDFPNGTELQQGLLGTGVQIYTYNGTAWASTNVSADLYNINGQKVGHHFYLAEEDANGGQPTWETFYPFSRVTGKSLENVPSPRTDSIAWLLLEATTNMGDLQFFGSTTFVQRIYTEYGLPPSADIPATTGDVFRSKYSALYRFANGSARSY